MLSDVLKYTRRIRELFLDVVDSLNIDQLNKTPKGFNNNIAWNFGHIVITAQALSYKRSGVDPDMNISYFNKYQKRSKPENFIAQEEINNLKRLLFSTIDAIDRDIKNNVFTNVKPFSTTTFGFEITSIEEILTCSLAHDSMHYGIAFTQRKLVL